MIRGFDIMKMQRPERSGLISVMICFAIFNFYFDVVGPKASPDDPFSWKCFLFEPLCWDKDYGDEHPPDQTVADIKKHYHMVLLYGGNPFGGHLKGKKPCTCHIDAHIFGEPIMHAHSQQEPSCDSELSVFGDGSREWKTVPKYHDITVDLSGKVAHIPVHFEIQLFGSFIELPGGKAEYRWHCDDGGQR